MHDPLGEMNMLPAKPEQFTPTHSRFNGENNELL